MSIPGFFWTIVLAGLGWAAIVLTAYVVTLRLLRQAYIPAQTIDLSTILGRRPRHGRRGNQ